jgi:hypothetical protein
MRSINWTQNRSNVRWRRDNIQTKQKKRDENSKIDWMCDVLARERASADYQPGRELSTGASVVGTMHAYSIATTIVCQRHNCDSTTTRAHSPALHTRPSLQSLLAKQPPTHTHVWQNTNDITILSSITLRFERVATKIDDVAYERHDTIQVGLRTTTIVVNRIVVVVVVVVVVNDNENQRPHWIMCR